MSPNSGSSSAGVAVDIVGSNFEPIPIVKLGTYMLTSVRYLGPTHLTGVLPALPKAGYFPLLVTNPDGKSATLENAYELTVLVPAVSKVAPSFGFNTFPSRLTISGSGFTDGSVVRLSTGTIIALETEFVSASMLSAVVPANFDPGNYSLSVINPDSQTSQAVAAAYEVVDNSHDAVDALENGIWLSPNSIISGNAVSLGITLHREGGKVNFTDLAISFYLGEVTPAKKIGDAVVTNLEPNHDFSSSSVTWNTPAAGNYTILAKIDPNGAFKANHPNITLPSEPIQQTVRVLPRSVDSVPPVIEDLVIGGADSFSTSSQEVMLHTIANDPNNGSGIASLLYIESVYSQSAAAWTQVSTSGWIPIGADPYTWLLSPESGVKYLQVWAADKSGNISLPFGKWINYIPASGSVDQGMTRVFRYHLTAGQRLSVSLQPGASQDADLFLWANVGGVQTLLTWSNQDKGLTDSITYTAPAEGIEVQLEVFGFTSTTFTLTNSVDLVNANHPSLRMIKPKLVNTKVVPDQPAVYADSVPPSQVKVPDAPVSNIIRFTYCPVLVRVVQAAKVNNP